MKATASVRIARPIDEVFDYVTDVTRMPEWVGGVREARLVSDTIEKGATYILIYSGMVRRPTELEVEVTAFERPHLFVFTTTRGPIEIEGVIELAEDDGGTLVSTTAQGGDDLATRVASWLLGWLVSKPWSDRLRSELENLAAAIERNAKTS